jgi:hypothetical protein
MNNNKVLKSKKPFFTINKKVVMFLGFVIVVGAVLGALYGTGVIGKEKKSDISDSQEKIYIQLQEKINKQKKLVIEKNKNIMDVYYEKIIVILNKMENNLEELKNLEAKQKKSFIINQTNLELFESNILEGNKLYKEYEMVRDEDDLSTFKKETAEDDKYLTNLYRYIKHGSYESSYYFEKKYKDLPEKYVELLDDYTDFYHEISVKFEQTQTKTGSRSDVMLNERINLQYKMNSVYVDKLKRDINFYIDIYKKKQLPDEKDKEKQAKMEALLVRFTSGLYDREDYDDRELSTFLLIKQIKKEFEAIKNNP